MATTAEMVKELMGGSTSELLIRLTNSAGSASSINDTVLSAAATKAEGRFRIETGLDPDADTDWHQGALAAGTIYYLEFAKRTDAALVAAALKEFIDACKAIRGKAATTMGTSSTLSPKAEKVGNRPDLDRDGFVGDLYEGRSSANRINDYSPDNDDDV